MSKGLDLSLLDGKPHLPLLLSGVPIPPSDNHQYSSTIRKNKKTGVFKSVRIPSTNFTRYKKRFDEWCLLNMHLIHKARAAVKNWPSPIEVHFFFALEEQKLIGINKKLKKLDANNRDKCLQDLLAAALFIDDSILNVTRCEKVIAPPNSEQVLVLLVPSRLRTLVDVYDSLDTRVL